MAEEVTHRRTADLVMRTWTCPDMAETQRADATAGGEGEVEIGGGRDAETSGAGRRQHCSLFLLRAASGVSTTRGSSCFCILAVGGSRAREGLRRGKGKGERQVPFRVSTLCFQEAREKAIEVFSQLLQCRLHYRIGTMSILKMFRV